MKQTECTVHLDGPDTACGNSDQCTRVVMKHKGKTTHKHWVCSACRERMKLPEYDCQIDEFQRIQRWV